MADEDDPLPIDETRRPSWLKGAAPEGQAPGRPDLAGLPDPLDDADERDDPPHLQRGSPREEGPAPYDEPGPEIP